MKSFSKITLLLCVLALTACYKKEETKQRAMAQAGGNPDRGKAAIATYGCGSCHTIPGVHGADGLVGPSLEKIASRNYIGGVLQNNGSNLVQWIENPPAIDDKTAMPNIHVTTNDARDIATYLYTLK